MVVTDDSAQHVFCPQLLENIRGFGAQTEAGTVVTHRKQRLGIGLCVGEVGVAHRVCRRAVTQIDAVEGCPEGVIAIEGKELHRKCTVPS